MNKEELWDITNREQTQIKLNILEQYLRQWAIIIGERFIEGYYIDCFAGRGKYYKGGIKDCVLGSPLIAQKISLTGTRTKTKKGENISIQNRCYRS